MKNLDKNTKIGMISVGALPREYILIILLNFVFHYGEQI